MSLVDLTLQCMRSSWLDVDFSMLFFLRIDNYGKFKHCWEKYILYWPKYIYLISQYIPSRLKLLSQNFSKPFFTSFHFYVSFTYVPMTFEGAFLNVQAWFIS